MKNEFKTGEYCKFPNEEIPHILDILRANGHPVWKGTAVYQLDQDIIACSTDGDLMGYWSKEPEIKTELTRHDFMCKALRLEEGMGISYNNSSICQIKHIARSIIDIGLTAAGSVDFYHDHDFSSDLNTFAISGNMFQLCFEVSTTHIPYLEWCKRLCVEPIGQVDTLQDGDWFEGTFNQYAESKRLSNLSGEGVSDINLFAGWAVENDNHALYDGEWICYNGKECGAATNKLTAEEFLRRARNTFQEPIHTEPVFDPSKPWEFRAECSKWANGFHYIGIDHDGRHVVRDMERTLYFIFSDNIRNTPGFNASMLEVGEYMETIEFAGERQLIKRISQNNWIEYLNGHDSFGRLLAEELKGCKVDVEIKVREL